MSCFGGGVATTYSSSSLSGGMMRGGGSRSRRPWWWWRAKCAGIAASVGSKLRRSIRKGLDGRRRRRRRATTTSVKHTHHHHRRQYSSFAPVYVDELYSYHQQPQLSSTSKALKLNGTVAAVQEEPSTSGKLVAPDATYTRATSGKQATTARVAAAAATTTTATAGGKPPRAAAAAATGVGGAMRNILMRSPGRGGGGVLGVVKGMGEVDLRAELFIRKFKEDMRLQSQRSAEELQAMLARGL